MSNKFFCLALGLLLFNAASAFAQRVEDFQLERPTTHALHNFGDSCSIDGEWAVVGDPTGNSLAGALTGTCSMYRRTEQGWALWQVISPGLELGLQEFGVSVALVCDELFVGARVGGLDGAGRVHIYRLVHGLWAEVQQLQGLHGAAHDVYGQALACDGQTLVVGSPGVPDPVNHGAGACYIYVAEANGWVYSGRLPFPPPASAPHSLYGGFGKSVAVDEDVIVVGAPGFGQGMAFAYRRGTAGWQRETDLYLPQFSPGQCFALGSSVAVSGATIAVGAPSRWDPWAFAPSSVWIYDYDSNLREWQQVQGFRASDWNSAPLGDLFGGIVVLRQDRLLISAIWGAINGAYEGTAYLFTRSDGVWSEAQRFVASDPNPPPHTNGAWFSTSVDMDSSNNRILVGAGNAQMEGDLSYSGRAYCFDLNQGTVVCPGPPNGIGELTRLTVTGNRAVSNASVSLSVYDGPPGRMGLFLVGPGGAAVPIGDFGSLCVGQPFARLTGVVPIGSSGGAMHQMEFTSPAVSSLVLPGARLTFQFIFRDVNFLSHTPTISVSDAVEVLFE